MKKIPFNRKEETYGGNARLVSAICEQLNERGKAKFDFGTFRLFKRGGYKITLRQTGKQKKLKPYNAVFFRASNELRRVIKEVCK